MRVKGESPIEHELETGPVSAFGMSMVKSTQTPALMSAAVQEAADLLRAGEVVVVPTETVYGLAANAIDSRAVEKIFRIKGRPSNNPIIVHVADLEMARECVAEWTSAAEALARAFWPGPLTLVLRKASCIPKIVTAGGETVGIRWPSHPVIQEIIQRCGFPLAAPSANPSGCASATTAEHAKQTLGGRVALIVDGGPARIGIESTVLDLCEAPPRILRPGMIHAESLAAVIGPVSSGGQRAEGTLRSPGLLSKHYAPKAKLVIWDGADPDFLTSRIRAAGLHQDRVHLLVRGRQFPESGVARIWAMPRDPETFARAFYAELHRADQAGAELIVVEAVPDLPEWRAIADRVRRAAAEP